MTVAIIVVATLVAGLLSFIAAGLIDSPSTKAQAQLEARAHESRPIRRRIPRTSTFIAQPRRVIEPPRGSRISTAETVLFVGADGHLIEEAYR